MTEQTEKMPANFAESPDRVSPSPADGFRSTLRRERLAARAAMPAAQRALASQRVGEILWDYLSGLTALPERSLAFCWPIRGEIDCRPTVLRLINAGWQVAMPVVVERAAPMRFHAWWPAVLMMQDPHGIPVPATQAVAAPAIWLLPLLAFDSAGFRLGYGGGYFDRTLAAADPLRPPLAIGIGYATDRVASIHPAAHDRPLTAAITDAGLIRFAALDFPPLPVEDGGRHPLR